MATRKQQRRRAKHGRHEWVYVDVDEDGNEVEVDPGELRAEKERVKPKTSAPASSARGGARPARTVKPPSWRRVGRRGLIFAPLMFLLVLVTARNASTVSAVVTAVIMMAVFLPFSYVMDSMMYRMYLKRGGKPPAEEPAGGRRRPS